jgi:hypothetical protein
MTSISQVLGFFSYLAAGLIGVSLMASTLTLFVVYSRLSRSNTPILLRRIVNSDASMLLFWLGYFLTVFGLIGLWSS